MADSTRMVSAIVFGIAVLLWLAFGVLLAARQGNLAEPWDTFRGQPFIFQALEFIVFLPWAAALWIWNTSWELWIRAVLLAGLAVASLYLLYPWRQA